MTARQYRQFTGVSECVRCCRSQADHDRRDDGDYDDVQARIWKALGWPCARFTDSHGQIYAANQAAISRWGRRRPAAAPASVPGADPSIAQRHAAAARAALLNPGHRTERP